MSAVEAMLRGRRLAESLMRSMCTITRAGTGPRVFDEATGTYTDPPRVPVYVGRCKVQDADRTASEAEAGDREAGVVGLSLHLPIDGSGGVARDDVAVIDSNPDDPALVGRRFVVRAPHDGTLKTARRLPVEAVV